MHILRIVLVIVGCGALGIACLRSPFKVVRLILLKWSLFWIGGTRLPEKGQEAVYLLEHDQAGFEEKFASVISTMRLSGWVLLMISLTSLCMLVLGEVK